MMNQVSSLDIDHDFVEKYLSKFTYEDWEDNLPGYDTFNLSNEEYQKLSQLSLNDFVIIVYEEPSTGNQTLISARVVIDDNYNIPCFIINEDLEDFGNSGDLVSIHDTALNGGMFILVSEKSWFENLRNL